MIDFHCHLDLYPDALKLLPEVARRNIFTLVVTTSPRAWLGTSRVFAGFETIKVALGLHPEIFEKKASEQELLLKHVTDAEFIGEVGLDGTSRFVNSLAAQEKFLDAVLQECEVRGGRIISLHSRGAATRVLDLISSYPQCGTPVLHWFSGTLKELQRAIDLGCWFSVGPAMLEGEKGRNLFSAMPLERVVPETDGPFATKHGKPLFPWQASTISRVAAQAFAMNLEEVEQAFRNNLRQLLRGSDWLSAREFVPQKAQRDLPF
ncbi:Qat anti-phage system TatD family nuclease QatD [Caballeronia sp. LZ019]|uniref:Qat anti-phage system TatD family nuclease QatD n=1 Tax=Caballeronia sp. LZ019 TaxID=3038555 RepID=UPI002856874C|nr:Qat anti-phage system TatD family nuclease QatD [Caballeronia sp. LZ019]MDR5810621.1 TatD family hydrolase [Caballeronia sp. LZ019]